MMNIKAKRIKCVVCGKHIHISELGAVDKKGVYHKRCHMGTSPEYVHIDEYEKLRCKKR